VSEFAVLSKGSGEGFFSLWRWVFSIWEYCGFVLSEVFLINMNFESLLKPLFQVRNRFWLLVPHQEQEVVEAKRRSRRPWEQPLIGTEALWTIHPTAAGYIILFPFFHDAMCGCLLGDRRAQPLPFYLVMRIDNVVFYQAVYQSGELFLNQSRSGQVLHFSCLLRVVTSLTPLPLFPHS
jgi:hypothetical protein